MGSVVSFSQVSEGGIVAGSLVGAMHGGTHPQIRSSSGRWPTTETDQRNPSLVQLSLMAMAAYQRPSTCNAIFTRSSQAC
jgi:hypothetical protein